MIAPWFDYRVNTNMLSMTGYGSGSSASKDRELTVQVEITSVNRKSLDIQLSAPKDWTGLEQRCSEWLKGHFERGRINLQIRTARKGAENTDLAWNETLMAQAIQRLGAFAEAQGLEFAPDAQLLLQLAQSLKEASGLPDWKEIETTIKEAFDVALSDLDKMRSQEGENLRNDLETRIDEMSTLTQTIKEHASGATATYKNRLLERLCELDLDLDLDDERVLKEVAIFADRIDVSEEITRLNSHFDQFRQLLGSARPSGRKMDFLCQEIHRELNTTGSKSQQIEIKRAVIDGKNALERVREQVQNVE